MESLGSIMDRYKNKHVSPPRHEKAAAVNEIIKVLGDNKTYNYPYWLKKVGSASYSVVLEILKEAAVLPSQYSKGGYVTNKLKQYVIPNSKPKGPRTNRRGSASNKEGTERKIQPTRVQKVDDNERRMDTKSSRKSGN